MSHGSTNSKALAVQKPVKKETKEQIKRRRDFQIRKVKVEEASFGGDTVVTIVLEREDADFDSMSVCEHAVGL